MHLSIVSPQYLSSNHTAFHPFDRFCPSFDPHHCSANGFFNSQEMISKSPSFVKNHTNSNGSYTRTNSWVARERHEKRASSSTSVIVFCNSHRFLSESTLLLKNSCNFSGFYTRSCAELARDRYSKGASNAKSGDGFFAIKGNHGNSSGIVCEGIGERDDGFYMRRCVENARKAIGCTSPNPMVGCVIVKNGKIVGEGFHPKAGQPHAEVFALKDAGVLAENATAYVSLEPCNHHGRTPPCTEALIRAKVKHVVVGMVDPNPIVASKGVERLRESGIEVTVGVEEELCWKLNEAYIHRMLTGKPFVTLRYSVSFNGRIMDKLGKGAEESGGYYSQLLQEYDSVIMSSTSLRENSTFPASQEPGANQPLRIIIATASKLPLHLPAVALEACIPAIVFADKSVVVDPTTAHHLDQLGIETVVLEQMDLSAIIDYCGRRGLCSVLLDLRGDSSDCREILETGFEGGLLQKVVMEVCPFWGGTEETSSVLACKSLERKSMGLKNLQSWISKGSVVVEGYI